MGETEALIVGGITGGLVGAGAGYQAGYNQRDKELQQYIAALQQQLLEEKRRSAELELRLKRQTLISQIRRKLGGS